MLNTYVPAHRFVVLDIEFVDDPVLYARYRRIDPRPADSRWPMRRIVAATVMSLTVEGGTLEVEGFTSFSGGAEDVLLLRLFAYLNERQGHRLVTYAGLSTEIPMLRLAAMAHDLKLPSQLSDNRRDRSGQWAHLDLAVLMKCGAGSYVHLAEIATRLNLPCKFGGSAMNIPELVARREYRKIEWISEADVIATGMILASHLASTGDLISAEAAHYAILKHVRPLRGEACYRDYLGNVADRLRSSMRADLQRWMARVS